MTIAPLTVTHRLRYVAHATSRMIALTAALAATSGVAQAHKLNLFTYVEGSKVHVDGYFADGTKARQSSVTVRNSAREIIVEGSTDEQGQFSFTLATPSALQIVLNSGLGHQAEALLSEGEFGGDTPETTAAAIPAPTKNMAVASKATPTAAATMATFDAQQLETTVQRAVSEGLRPLAKEIMELREKAKVSDMIGGVGFIVGVFGMWALLRSRRNEQPETPVA